MTHHDSSRNHSDASRPERRRRGGSRDPARVAGNDAAAAWSDSNESSYRAAAAPIARPATGRHSGDEPLAVRIEFVRLDGPEGQALRRRQAQIMRKVLQWIADHPDPANQ
jgi:hypothetical protein